MLNLKWSFGNAKVSKLDAVSFGIPAFQSADGFKTCPKAGACAAICYARQGHYTMPNVANAREYNLRIIRESMAEFVKLATLDLARIPSAIVRVHDSGDFFSQGYVNAWAAVARAFPGKTFYAYTKSLHLDYSKLPSNFRLVQSEGGKLDAEIDKGESHSRIFATHEARKRAGYVNGSINDGPAIRGEVRIGLVYHGNKNLTAAQSAYFS